MTKVALICDIHFGKFGREGEFSLPLSMANGESVNMPSMTDGVVNILQKHEVEYLFVGGDLTSVGSPAEFYYSEKKVLEIAHKANIDEGNIIWCTGNHDNDWQISSLFESPNSESEVKEYNEKGYKRIATYAASLSMETLTKTIKENESGPLPVSYIKETDKFVAFVLNSASESTKEQEYKHGVLTECQRDWFKAEVEKYKDDSRWKIVLLHHHPFGYKYPVHIFDVSQLEDGNEFLNIAGANGINLVLHGHRHHPMAKTNMESGWSNPITFICGGSLSVNEKHRNNGDIPNTFCIAELDDEHVGELVLYTYEYGAGSGWRKVKDYREEVPLDGEMKFGKFFNESDKIVEIEKYKERKDDPIVIERSELPISLQYDSSKVINQLFKNSVLKESFQIKAELPTNILLKRKPIKGDER